MTGSFDLPRKVPKGVRVDGAVATGDRHQGLVDVGVGDHPLVAGEPIGVRSSACATASLTVIG